MSALTRYLTGVKQHSIYYPAFVSSIDKVGIVLAGDTKGCINYKEKQTIHTYSHNTHTRIWGFISIEFKSYKTENKT